MEKSPFRPLERKEVNILKEQGNLASDWNTIYITNETDLKLITGNRFKGKIYIGSLKPREKSFESRIYDIGIRNSSFLDCVIGNNPVIENVDYIADAQIGDEVILFHVGEILASDDPPYLMNICNENGGRAIIPFPGMNAGDAFLMSRNRDNSVLQNGWQKKAEIIWKDIPFNLISDNSVIINSGRIIHCRLLSGSIIRGLKLGRNLLLNGSGKNGCRIDNATELKNGILESGASVGAGVIAANFFMGESSSLDQGARFFHSFLGACSHINCCEIQNSLLFPFHEQHHNNSFLIASVIKGQSNIAAGATIGSNHNSRRNDGELVAERGFWPGLNVSLKHNSWFAPFTLLVKGNYNYEINNPYPFSLVWNNEDTGELSVYPAFMLLHNLYSLERGKYKFMERDQRISVRNPAYEYDYLAPDTADYIVKALVRLKNKENVFYDNSIENGRRQVSVFNGQKAEKAYEDALILYATKTLLQYRNILNDQIEPYEGGEWFNFGGYCINEKMCDDLDSITDYYRKKHNQNLYILEKVSHAYSLFKDITGIDFLNMEGPEKKKAQTMVKEILQNFEDCIYNSRAKDYEDLFRQEFYHSQEERDAVIGKISDDPLFHRVETEFNEIRKEIMD